MLQPTSIKSLAFRVLREMSARKLNLKPCPNLNVRLGHDAGHPASPTHDSVPLNDVDDLGLRKRMEDSVRRFEQPYARLFPLIGLRVWTPEGPGRLLSVFARCCEVHPEGTEKTIRVRPEEVRLIQ
jgi:hypothetical protein